MNVVVINGAGFVDICCITIDDMIYMYEVCCSYGYPLSPDILEEFSSDNFQSLEKYVRSVQIQTQVKSDHILLMQCGITDSSRNSKSFL